MSCNAARDEVHERLGNLGCGPFAVVTIPLRHPVDRTQQREYGELRIAGRDAAVLDAFPDQLAEALLGLVAPPDERPRLVGKQRAVLEQHHRMPQLADEVLEVAAQRDRSGWAARYPRRARPCLAGNGCRRRWSGAASPCGCRIGLACDRIV